MLYSFPEKQLSKHPLFTEHIDWLDKNWAIEGHATKLPPNLLQSIDTFGLKFVNRGLFNFRRKVIRTVESSLRSLISILKELAHVQPVMRREINGLLNSLQESQDFALISKRLRILDSRIQKKKIEDRDSTSICPREEIDCGTAPTVGSVNLRRLVSVAELQQVYRVLKYRFESKPDNIRREMLEHEHWVVESDERVLALIEVSRKDTRLPCICDSLFSRKAELLPDQILTKVIELLKVEYSISEDFCKLGIWLGLIEEKDRESYLEFQLKNGYLRLWIHRSFILIVVTSGQSIVGHNYPSGTWWVRLTRRSGKSDTWDTMSEIEEGIDLRMLKLVIECEQLGEILKEVEAGAYVSRDPLKS